MQSGFHVACSAPRIQRGDPRNWLDFFLFESAPREPRGEGLGRDSRPAVPGRFPIVLGERRRDRPVEAFPKTAHRSKETRFYLVIYTRYRLAAHVRATLGHSKGGGCVPSWTTTPIMCMCDIVSEVVFAQPHPFPPALKAESW